jgi:hypothetical protein
MLLGSGAELQPGEEYDDVDLPALLEENKGVEVEFCTLGWCIQNKKTEAHYLYLLFLAEQWSGTLRVKARDWSN